MNNHATGAAGAVYGAGTVNNIHFSRFVGNTCSTPANGNTLGAQAATLNANDNWWGQSSGPAANDATANVTRTNWLQLKTTASPATIVTNQITAVTSSLFTDSASNPVTLANLVTLIGQPVTFSAVGGTISGAQATIQANGTATATYTATAANVSNSATAVVDNGPNSGSTNTGAITVNKANATASISSDTPDPTVTGQAVAVSYSVLGASGNAPTVPTGNVVVSDGVNSATGTVAAGSASPTLFTVGSRTLTATYQGDGNFNASPASAGAAHTVNKADTTAAITSDPPDPSVTGQTVVVHFTVAVTSPGSGTPTGNLAVSDGVNSGTGTVASGQANIVLASAGNHNLTATYQGDSAITSDAPDPSLAGQAVTVQFTVTANSPGSGTPTGNVMVSDGVDSAIGTVAAGQASITLNTAGNRTLTATYQGDSNFNASLASLGAAHTVNQPPTITSASSTTFTVAVNGTFNVTTPGFPTPGITRTGAALPAGVTFTDNGNGTGTLAGIPAAGTGGATYGFTFTASNGVPSNAVQSFTLTVLSPIEAWRSQKFGSPSNSGNGADDADPDKDGLKNLLEYVLNLNPLAPNISSVVYDTTTGFSRLTVPKNPAATDVTLTIQVTGNLLDPLSWTTTRM